MAEKRPVTATFRVVMHGFAADLEASGTLDELVRLAEKLGTMDGVKPGNSPLLWPSKDAGNGSVAADASAPSCPVHGTPMKPSTKSSGWYCSRKNADGSYCREKVNA